jgi:hypothetical protein
MAKATFRGVVHGGKVEFLEKEPPLTEGTEVLVTPLALAPGTAAAVLAAVEAPPHVPVEWVDELEQVIAAGRRPPTRNDPFAEQRANPESR